MTNTDKHIIDKTDILIQNIGNSNDSVIALLQAVQSEYNYLPQVALERICETTKIHASTIIGIATFYTQFRLQPVGKHIIKVCVGTACHVKGANRVYDSFCRNLKLDANSDTDSRRIFTIEKVACLGCCTIAPVVQIDNITYGHVTTDATQNILDSFLASKMNDSKVNVKLNTDSGFVQGEILVGLGSCCVASGSVDVKNELENSLQRNKIHVDVKHVGCVGICNQVPMLEIHKPGEPISYYTKIKPDEVNDVIRKHFTSNNLFHRFKNNFYNYFDSLISHDLPKSVKHYDARDTSTPISAFLQGQLSIATEYRGEIRPTDLNEYRNKGGFEALNKCLHELSSAEIIQIIQESGLRGRGGAGFSTGLKWQFVSNVVSDKKYIICNGDEGDPGAFMDRMLLESYPFRIIEGFVIAAYAVGANEGVFYIRAEYPLAVKRILEAIEICKRENLLGNTILNSSFNLNVRVFEGAGAFVCGEETALIASIEGKRGLPNIRPPYPAKKGLYGKPTLINNVETLSMVPWIINKGDEAFSKIGTPMSKGTKVFALAGKVNRGGLIEVPMGIHIRTIVEEIGGGIQHNKLFKAIQIGGPSGGCIPASMADLTIDYESLKSVGAMMGSGGLIVLDNTDCMVDIARYFLSFTQNQSCGRCTFCRIGTKRMLEILNKICSGKGILNDLVVLEELAHKTIKGSICGLGKTAPNPVLSTLRYFRDEYEAHLNGHCPAGKCKDIIRYEITNQCIGCTKCAQHCPTGAIKATPYQLHIVDDETCIRCDACKQVCPHNAVVTI